MRDGLALLLVIGLAGAVVAATALLGVRRRRPAPSHRADTWVPRGPGRSPSPVRTRVG